MTVHTVARGESLFYIASLYGISFRLIAVWNGLTEPYPLTVGQSLLILTPGEVYTSPGDESAPEIASAAGIPLRTLYAYNPGLYGGVRRTYANEQLVLSYNEEKLYRMRINSYAYPFIQPPILSQTLPYLTYMTPFTYGITNAGGLVLLDDTAIINASFSYGTSPLMHLSTLTEEGKFSSELAMEILSDPAKADNLLSEILRVMREKGYTGLDIDFEYVRAEYAQAYVGFISSAVSLLSPYGYTVTSALAPKTSAAQPGLLYEGHLYGEIGAAADNVLVMTYEWGYTYGPPMAVAPIPSVRAVLDYAVTEIPPSKIYMGVPNYGYDWRLPYRNDGTAARSISNEEAVRLAVMNGAEIRYDTVSQSPYFNYYTAEGEEHEVWFEDARSVLAKLSLISEYGLAGAGYWNAMRPFNANWLITAVLYDVPSGFDVSF